MRASLLLAGLALVSLPLTGVVRGETPAPTVAAPAPATTTVLAGDPRLDRKIDVRETGASIRELLLGLSDEGLLLAADPSCADQKLFVRLKGRSLRGLMRSLEELLPGAWTKVDGRNYRLSLTDEARRRRDRWWKLLAEQREHSKKAIREGTLRAMRSEPPPVEGPENPRLRAQSDASAGVFRNLPPYLQERIAGALNEKVLDAPAFNSRDTEAGVDVPLRDLPEGVQRRFRDAIRGYDSPAAQSQDLTVRFANLGSAVLAAVASGGEPLFDGNALFSHFTGYGMGGMDFSPDTLLRGLDHEWFTSPRFPQKRIPEHWKPLLEYAKSRVWENAPLEARPYSPMPEAVQRRSALLDVLANEGGAEIVADYHSARPSGINSAKFDELRRSLPDRITSEVKEKVVGEVLNGVASWYDASWKASVASPGVYLVRNNRWYRDDLLEVPNKLLDRWIAHRHSRMTVEDVRPFKPGTRIYTTGRDGRSRAEVVRATAPVPDGAAAPPKQRRAVYLTAHRMTPEQLQGHLDWQAEVVAALTPAQVAHGLRSAVPEEGRGIPRPARGDAPDAAMAEVVRLTTGNRPLFSFDADEIVRRRPLLEFYALLDPAARAALIAGTLDPSRLTDPQREKATALLPSLNGTGGTLGLDARRSRLVLRPATPDAGTRAPGGQP